MFGLTSKAHHATRIMVCLARSNNGASKKIQEIAEEEGIPEPFAGQILSTLKTANLVRSRSGIGGGFSLARDSSEITVYEVLSAMEGSVLVRPCLSNGCQRASWCMSRVLWQKANDAVVGIFSGTTIADMVTREDALHNPEALHFDI